MMPLVFILFFTRLSKWHIMFMHHSIQHDYRIVLCVIACNSFGMTHLISGQLSLLKRTNDFIGNIKYTWGFYGVVVCLVCILKSLNLNILKEIRASLLRCREHRMGIGLFLVPETVRLPISSSKFRTFCCKLSMAHSKILRLYG